MFNHIVGVLPKTLEIATILRHRIKTLVYVSLGEDLDMGQ